MEKDTRISGILREHIWLCDICLRNAHQKVNMVKRVVVSTDEKGYWEKEMLLCPKCGNCKSL